MYLTKDLKPVAQIVVHYHMCHNKKLTGAELQKYVFALDCAYTTKTGTTIAKKDTWFKSKLGPFNLDLYASDINNLLMQPYDKTLEQKLKQIIGDEYFAHILNLNAWTLKIRFTRHPSWSNHQLAIMNGHKLPYTLAEMRENQNALR